MRPGRLQRSVILGNGCQPRYCRQISDLGWLEATWLGGGGDGTGQLTIRAESNGFSGIGQAWFDEETLKTFGASIARFPLPDTQEVTISGGFPGDNPQVHVGITVYPVGSLGQLGVGVILATPMWDNDRPTAGHHAELEVLTSYDELDRFARQFVELIDGSRELASLGHEQPFL